MTAVRRRVSGTVPLAVRGGQHIQDLGPVPATCPVRRVTHGDSWAIHRATGSALDLYSHRSCQCGHRLMHALALVRDAAPELVVAGIRMLPTHTTEGLEWPG